MQQLPKIRSEFFSESPVENFSCRARPGNFQAQAPPIPAKARGLAASRVWVLPWGGDRIPFGNCRYRNGHRDVHVPEILGE